MSESGEAGLTYRVIALNTPCIVWQDYFIFVK